jgi:BMFP domain-containing protein YqiC
MIAIICAIAYMDVMQTQNPFLDELAKLTTAAMGLAQSAGDEAKTAFRAHADRIAAEFDLVRREDFEALKAQVATLTAELAALKAPADAATKPASKAAPKTPKKGQ